MPLSGREAGHAVHFNKLIQSFPRNLMAQHGKAANGAVIASSEHIPLLYVTEDSVPSETEDALNSLGVSEIIFVEIDDVGSQVKDALSGYTITDLNTMQQAKQLGQETKL